MDDAELVMAYSKARIIDEKDTDAEKIVSISGSKGKDLISEEDWESELYKEARRNRSAVESLIFVLKYSFEFGRLRRRGIDAVREELLEKAIVHNFSRMIHISFSDMPQGL